MQLEVGDCVIHRTFGIGHIVDMVHKSRAGLEARLYYEVDLERTTVWVPVESNDPSSIRPITRKEELDRYRKILSSHPDQLDDDYRRRQLALDGRLKSGTLQAMCETVRDLTARSKEKTLSGGDTAMLHKVEETLHKEWSTSEGISLAEASQEIVSLLLTSQRK